LKAARPRHFKQASTTGENTESSDGPSASGSVGVMASPHTTSSSWVNRRKFKIGSALTKASITSGTSNLSPAINSGLRKSRLSAARAANSAGRPSELISACHGEYKTAKGDGNCVEGDTEDATPAAGPLLKAFYRRRRLDEDFGLKRVMNYESSSTNSSLGKQEDWRKSDRTCLAPKCINHVDFRVSHYITENRRFSFDL
ncbi:unnamed protein product, partial [Protopolystoma xenopodis]